MNEYECRRLENAEYVDKEPRFFKYDYHQNYLEDWYPINEFNFEAQLHSDYRNPSRRSKFGVVPSGCFRNCHELTMNVYEHFCFDEIDTIFLFASLENIPEYDKVLVPAYERCFDVFGSLAVDLDVIQELLANDYVKKVSRFDNKLERKLEIQAQYVSYMLKKTKNPDIKIVPIMIGKLKESYLYNLARLLQKYVDNPRSIFIFSCSLSRLNGSEFNLAHKLLTTETQTLFQTNSSSILENFVSLNPRQFEKACMLSGPEAEDFDLLMLLLLTVKMNMIESRIRSLEEADEKAKKKEDNDGSDDRQSRSRSKSSSSKKRSKSPKKNRNKSNSSRKRSKSPKKKRIKESKETEKELEPKHTPIDCSPVVGLNYSTVYFESKNFELFESASGYISFCGACIEAVKEEITVCPEDTFENHKAIGPIHEPPPPLPIPKEPEPIDSPPKTSSKSSKSKKKNKRSRSRSKSKSK